MTRRSFSVALALAVFTVGTVEAKPRKFSWEVSPYLSARDYDSSLEGLSTHGVYGLRLGYNITRHWEVEAGLGYDPGNTDRRVTPGPRTEVDVDTLDLNVVLNLNTDVDTHQKYGRWISGDRWVPYVTAGIGHFAADSDVEGTRESLTFNVGGGVRLMCADFVGIRFDVRDVMSLDDEDFGDNFNNLEVGVGATFILGGTVPRDTDSDGVVDGADKCPGTPLGCWVDELGCPRDSDGDGVCDGLDRCPSSPAGCPVDQHGCPTDADGDGVCDGLDDCPDTPPSCWVNEKGCPKDSDGDTVCDGVDRCPDTPSGCVVDAQGCPKDSDGDGVCDGVDRCPDTPRGTKVDAQGCPVEAPVKLVVSGVYFEFNKADIQPFYRAILDEVAKSLLANDWRTLEIELRGHADAIDTVEYNYRLGEARANAVKEYLVARGVAPARLSTKSYSELEPAATNDTAEGRALNRRVEMVPTTAVQADRMTHLKILVRDVQFVAGGAELSAAGRAYLDDIAAAFSDRQLAGVRLDIVGHARGGAAGLAQQRADAVARYLAERGIAPDRLNPVGGGDRGDKADVMPVGAGR
jgi:OOP family OmpA-OmpF porin